MWGYYADVMRSNASIRPLALIPARGGSKRIRNKNIRILNGRPLLTWTIEFALSVDMFSDVIVSTDSPVIQGIARDAGASVPDLRPEKISTDSASTVQVLQHVLGEKLWAVEGEKPVCCLYPAAVCLEKTDLSESLELLDNSTTQFIASVTRYLHPPERAFRRSQRGIVMADSATSAIRTQDFEPAWHDAGQFYWAYASTWRQGSAVLPNSLGYELPTSRAIDLDREDDWRRLEIAHRLYLDRRGC